MTELKLAVYDTKKASQALAEVIKKSEESLTDKIKEVHRLKIQYDEQVDNVRRLTAELEGYKQAEEKLIAEGM